MVRRQTFERMLADQARAHAKERETLLGVISEQNDRIMYLAGRPWVASPLEQTPPPDSPEPELLVGDWDQLPDDLGLNAY